MLLGHFYSEPLGLDAWNGATGVATGPETELVFHLKSLAFLVLGSIHTMMDITSIKKPSMTFSRCCHLWVSRIFTPLVSRILLVLSHTSVTCFSFDPKPSQHGFLQTLFFFLFPLLPTANAQLGRAETVFPTYRV